MQRSASIVLLSCFLAAGCSRQSNPEPAVEIVPPEPAPEIDLTDAAVEIDLTDAAVEIDLREPVRYESEITLESGETLESGIVGPPPPD